MSNMYVFLPQSRAQDFPQITSLSISTLCTRPDCGRVRNILDRIVEDKDSSNSGGSGDVPARTRLPHRAASVLIAMNYIGFVAFLAHVDVVFADVPFTVPPGQHGFGCPSGQHLALSTLEHSALPFAPGQQSGLGVHAPG
jgi:hypothetical protein